MNRHEFFQASRTDAAKVYRPPQAARQERELSAAVNATYGLTREEEVLI